MSAWCSPAGACASARRRARCSAGTTCTACTWATRARRRDAADRVQRIDIRRNHDAACARGHAAVRRAEVSEFRGRRDDDLRGVPGVCAQCAARLAAFGRDRGGGARVRRAVHPDRPGYVQAAARPRGDHADGRVARPGLHPRELRALRLRQHRAQLRGRAGAAVPLPRHPDEPRADADVRGLGRGDDRDVAAVDAHSGRTRDARGRRQPAAGAGARHRIRADHPLDLVHHRDAARGRRRADRHGSRARAADGLELRRRGVRRGDPRRARQSNRGFRRRAADRSRERAFDARDAAELSHRHPARRDRAGARVPAAGALRPALHTKMISFIVLLSIVVCFSAILALALNFQWGLGGMVNFGLAGFYTLGAYTCALLILKGGANTFFATLGAMAIVAAACALTAFVTLRVAEEDYFAIVTHGVGEMLRLVALNEDWLTKGALGLSGIPRPLDGVIPSDVYVYFLLGLSIALLLGTLWVLTVLARAPFGRIVRALREDDVVAATLGKNVLWARVRIFAIGGAFIGLAGSLHAFYYQYIDPTQFTNIVIAYAFMAVIAGGRGAHAGAIWGAAVVMVLLEGSRFLKDAIPALDSDQLAAIRIIMIGVGLIALLIWRPQGFLREYRLKVSS